MSELYQKYTLADKERRSYSGLYLWALGMEDDVTFTWSGMCYL